MAEDVTTKFKVDISELKRDMQEAKRQVALANSEFKAVSSVFDDWSKNSEGLKAKLEQLDNVLEAQEKQLNSLEKQYELTVKQFGEGSKQAEQLEVNINNQKAAINNTKKEYEKYTDQLKKVSDAEKIASDTGRDVNDVLEEMEQATKDATKAAEKSEQGFTVMKGALSNLVSKGFELAIKGAKELANSFLDLGLKADDLNTLSKQSGFSTDELQKMEYAADLIDVSVDSIVSSAKKMKKNMVSESKDTVAAFEQLGVSVRDKTTGELRDSTDVFWDVVEALSTVSNETERDTLAMQIFGKSADELAGIIDDGGQALRVLGEEAEEVGAVLSQDTLDAANEFNDSVDKIKSTAKGVFAELGAEIAKEFVPELDDLRKKAQETAKKLDWSKIVKPVTKIIKGFIEVVKELAKKILPPMEKALGFVAKNFKEVSSAVLLGVGAFKAFKAAMDIASTVSAFSKAVSASTSAVELAEKAQVIWNAALSANPVGAVLSAVGLLAAGILLLKSALDDNEDSIKIFGNDIKYTGEQADTAAGKYQSAKEKSEELAKKFKAVHEEAKKDADAFKETKEKAEELANAEKANIEYTEALWEELQTLTSANGEVKAGYEGRAEFILGELNEALGTEYTMNGNIIEQYKQMQSEIDGIIEKKKAQILLDSYQESYEQAIKSVGNAEKSRAEAAQELAAQQETALRAEEAAAAARAALDKKLAAAKNESEQRSLGAEARSVYNLEQAAEREKNLLKSKQKAYDTASSVVEDYYTTIDKYQNASTLVIQGKTQEAIDALTELGNGFQTAASTAKLSAEEQKAVLEQQVIDTEVNLTIMKADYAAAQKDMTENERVQAEARIREAEREADKSKEEFSKVGGEIVKGMAEGSSKNGWILNDAMQKIVSDAISAAKAEAGLQVDVGSGNAGNLRDTLNGVANDYMNAVENIKVVSAPFATGTKAIESGVTNNYTQIINSPTQLNRLEIYRNSKNLLGLAGGV